MLVILTCSEAVMARTMDVRLRIWTKGDDEKIINRENLLKIKQFILRNGKRETYCNMYTGNPAYHSKGFQFYLNPDSGQQNINCDPAKSDFNTLTIRSSSGHYRTIEFIDQQSIYVSASWPADDVTVGQLRNLVEEALTQILVEMDQAKPRMNPEAAK